MKRFFDRFTLPVLCTIGIVLWLILVIAFIAKGS